MVVEGAEEDEEANASITVDGVTWGMVELAGTPDAEVGVAEASFAADEVNEVPEAEVSVLCFAIAEVLDDLGEEVTDEVAECIIVEVSAESDSRSSSTLCAAS